MREKDFLDERLSERASHHRESVCRDSDHGPKTTDYVTTLFRTAAIIIPGPTQGHEVWHEGDASWGALATPCNRGARPETTRSSG